MTNKHVSKTTDKLVSFLKRKKIPRADKVARALLLDAETGWDSEPMFKITRHNPLLVGVLGPSLTATALRDHLVQAGLIESSQGGGKDGWIFPITAKLAKLRQELANEAAGLDTPEKRIERLEKQVAALRESDDKLWAAIHAIQANDPPVTVEKIQRRLALVR